MSTLLREELSTIFAEEIAALRADKLLRKAKEEAKPAPSAAELSTLAAWNAYQGMAEQLAMPQVDTSPRAVQTRAILRIAQTYGWQSAIAHFLDTKGAAYLSDLTEPQLDDLHSRMVGYVDAAMTGCSLADCPPAT